MPILPILCVGEKLECCSFLTDLKQIKQIKSMNHDTNNYTFFFEKKYNYGQKIYFSNDMPIFVSIKLFISGCQCGYCG